MESGGELEPLELDGAWTAWVKWWVLAAVVLASRGFGFGPGSEERFGLVAGRIRTEVQTRMAAVGLASCRSKYGACR